MQILGLLVICILWCCGSESWDHFTFFQIGSGHTVAGAAFYIQFFTNKYCAAVVWILNFWYIIRYHSLDLYSLCHWRLKSLFYLPRRKLIRFIFQNLLPPYFWINWRISLCSKKQMRINHIQVWKKLLAFVCLVVWPHLLSLDHELTKITIVWFSKSIFCVKNQFYHFEFCFCFRY